MLEVKDWIREATQHFLTVEPGRTVRKLGLAQPETATAVTILWGGLSPSTAVIGRATAPLAPPGSAAFETNTETLPYTLKNVLGEGLVWVGGQCRVSRSPVEAQGGVDHAHLKRNMA